MNTNNWLSHAIKCCKNVNLDPFLLITKDKVKVHCKNNWNNEYIQMLQSHTLRFYKSKIIPSINNRLNLKIKGEYWLKAKSGCLLLNDRKHQICTRCNTGELEDLIHLIWKCPDNQNHKMIHLIKLLWDDIPFNKKFTITYNLSSYNELNTVTEWLFTDKVPGILAQQVSTIVENLYKIRPEMIQYNLITTM